MKKYKDIMDNTVQDQNEVNKLHQRIDDVLDRKVSDEFVSIEQQRNIDRSDIMRKNVNSRHLLRGVKVASVAVVLLVVAVISIYILKNITGEFSPGNTFENTPMPTVIIRTHEDVQGLQMTKEGIPELFKEGGPLYGTEYKEDDCFNVTTPEIKDKIGCTLVYVVDIENDSVDLLLLYDQLTDNADFVKLASGLKGWVGEIECSDFNNDGVYEIVFTMYSGNEGVPSLISFRCFDLEKESFRYVVLYDSISDHWITTQSYWYMSKMNDQMFFVYTDNEDDRCYLCNEEGWVTLVNSKQKSPENIESFNFFGGTKDYVDELFKKDGLREEAGKYGTAENCFNITPEIVKNLTGCQLFRFAFNKHIIVYNGKVVEMPWTNLGIKSMQVCDTDKDGEYEIIYTTKALYPWVPEASIFVPSKMVHFNTRTGEFTLVPYINNKSIVANADIIKITADIYEVVENSSGNTRFLGCVYLNDGELVYEEISGIVSRPSSTMPDTTPTSKPAYN